MSATKAPSAPAASSAPVASRLRRTWRRQRSLLVVGAGLLAAVAVVALLGAGPTTDDPLDPDNPGPDGARAVARVLGDEGVRVDVARSADELAGTEVSAQATLLVSDPGLLGEDGLVDLRRQYAGRRIVVAGAGVAAVRTLGSDAFPARVSPAAPVAARCEDPALGGLLDGLEVQVDDALAYPVPGCFTTGGGALVAQVGGVTLLGADQALGNDQVLRADNAALALRLLGQEPQLVWYVPSLSDLDGSEGVGLRTLLPPWIEPALVLAVLVVLATALWRGRRLGRLAVEPVPVVVRAVETTHSLGRLYRRSGDRAHTAGVLRRAALRRAAARLQLGRSADPDHVVRAVADHLGRREDEVAALLSPAAPPPATDPALITLARDLAELDREVRRA